MLSGWMVRLGSLMVGLIVGQSYQAGWVSLVSVMVVLIAGQSY